MKIVVIGAGRVGVSVCDYILLMGACSELVLVDIDRERAEGEIMDFSHTTALPAPRSRRARAATNWPASMPGSPPRSPARWSAMRPMPC